MTDTKVENAIARFDRITAQLDARDGPARDAARRERERLNAGLGKTALRIGLAVGVISLATIGVGMVMPIGMFGFLAAVGLAIAIAAVLAFAGKRESVATPTVTPDLPNGEMVQRFDSYLFRTRRSLPAAAQAEVDRLSAALPGLRQTLERADPNDFNAQDARRLMSQHLPGLIDRYLHVPQAYRGEIDGDGVGLEQRLVEGLAAGRTALADIGERLARVDVAAFETQGRFIQSRYKDDALD